jgi:hypothetical protein
MTVVPRAQARTGPNPDRGSLHDRVDAGLIAVAALAPLPTVALGFETALRLQLLIIVAALAGLFASGVASRGRTVDLELRERELPRPIRSSAILYLAGMGWGALVGLLVANPLRFVASQSISFLLLPVGAAVLLSARGRGAGRWLDGLAVAMLVGAGIHLFSGWLPGWDGGSLHEGLAAARRYGATLSAPALVAFFPLSLDALATRRPLPSAGALAALGLVVAGGFRSHWAGMAAAGIVTMVISVGAGGRRRLLHAAAGTVSALGLVLLYGATAAEPMRTFERGPIVGPEARREAATAPAVPAGEARELALFAVHGGTIETAADLSAGAGHGFHIAAEFQDAAGRPLGSVRRWHDGMGESVSYVDLFPAVAGARRVRLEVVAKPDGGDVRVLALRIRRVPPGPASRARSLFLRVRTLATIARRPTLDASLRYRFDELAAIERRWSGESVARRLAGIGLGGHYEFVNHSRDSRGGWTRHDTASYIHNYYVLLGFKLGIGGVATLAGLLLVTAWTFGRARPAARQRCAHLHLLVGAAAAWIAGLVASVTDPVLYDFRSAPLWGALVAIAVRASSEIMDRATCDGSRRADGANVGARSGSRTADSPADSDATAGAAP